MELKFIDLFAGMGGFRIGFEEAARELGYTPHCVFSSEIKPYAINVYQHNFAEKTIHGDITQIDENTIPDFDVLLAGFPCQAFSSAGKSLGFEDTRGTLFFDVARVLKAKQPKGFILENVEGLVRHDNGNTLKVILQTLFDLGYTTNWKLLDSKYHGLAQSRQRIYIVGTKNGTAVDLNFEKSEPVRLQDILEEGIPSTKSVFTKQLLKHYPIQSLYGKSIKDKRGGENNIHSWDIEIKGKVSKDQRALLNALLKQRRNKKWAPLVGIEWMDGMPLTLQMIETFYPHPKLKEILDDLVEKGYLVYEHPKQKVGNRRIPDEHLPKGYNIVTGKLSFEFNKILDPESYTPTLVATDVSKLAIPNHDGIRQMTIREGLRLFGFPESYTITIPNTKAFDLLGNTVCIPVIKKVALQLLKSI